MEDKIKMHYKYGTDGETTSYFRIITCKTPQTEIILLYLVLMKPHRTTL